jgi:formylglycine-generating enzyme required for sulfatase activity
MSSQPPYLSRVKTDLLCSMSICFLVIGCGSKGASVQTPMGEGRPSFKTASEHSEYIRHIPGSRFVMGSDTGEEDEGPQRSVLLSGYFLHETEVTVASYAACVEDGDCEPPAVGGECNWGRSDRVDHPVNCVSWYDAVRYCDWAGGRLPTEAEWEKGGRGEIGWPYPWGDYPADCSHAVLGNGLGCGELSTWPTGSFPQGRSIYGLHDMVGNVWEWTLDTYKAEAYDSLPEKDPVNLVVSDRKVLRGNSWYYSDPPLDSRMSNRYPFPAQRYYPYIGFRCAFQGADDPIAFDPAGALSSDIPTTVTHWHVRNDKFAMSEYASRQVSASPEATMVSIPAGVFTMGSDRGQHDERPVRTVYVDAFEIDRFEVRVSEYAECVDSGRCVEPYSGGPVFPKEWEWRNCNWSIPERSDHPINCVNWSEANVFCSWVEKRLPTEAEWEKAARGDDGRRYPWGEEQPDCDRAVIDSGGDGCGRETTWPVGSRPLGASPYGVEDLAGNVWEWVDDWYAYDYYSRAPDKNPRNEVAEAVGRQPGWATGKVLRGGSWADQATSLHSASHRLGYPQNVDPDYTVGFRCARDVIP